jgi:hypothetical protein
VLHFSRPPNSTASSLTNLQWTTKVPHPVSTTPHRQAYQGRQAQADSRELMVCCVSAVAYASKRGLFTDAVRERGRRMATLVCLPVLAEATTLMFSAKKQAFGNSDKQ